MSNLDSVIHWLGHRTNLSTVSQWVYIYSIWCDLRPHPAYGLQFALKVQAYNQRIV